MKNMILVGLMAIAGAGSVSVYPSGYGPGNPAYDSLCRRAMVLCEPVTRLRAVGVTFVHPVVKVSVVDSADAAKRLLVSMNNTRPFFEIPRAFIEWREQNDARSREE